MVKLTANLSLEGFFPALERGEITAGMVLIFRYQGPKGAPGMPEVHQLPQRIITS